MVVVPTTIVVAPATVVVVGITVCVVVTGFVTLTVLFATKIKNITLY